MSDQDSDSDFEIDEGCAQNYKCLLCEEHFSSSVDFFEHLSSAHDWSLKEDKRFFEDQIIWITFVNWVRLNKPQVPCDFWNLSEEQRMSFTHPVMNDDDVLMIDVESLAGKTSDENERNLDQVLQENMLLHEQIEKCRELINELANAPKMELVQNPHNGVPCYGQGNNPVICGYKPATFLLDKSVLNGFLNGLSEAIVKDKTVLNSFDDGGFLTVSAAKKGAKRVYIRKSPSSDNVVAVASANGVENKVEIISSLHAADVLFFDWMSTLFQKRSQPEIFSLIQSEIGTIYPPVATLTVQGVNVSESLIKGIIPPSSYLGNNLSSLVNAAYQKVYYGNWTEEYLTEVTREADFAKIHIKSAEKLESLKKALVFENIHTGKINGLLIYFTYESDSGEEIVTAKDSQFLGQVLVLLRKPLDVFEDTKTGGSINIHWNDSIEITIGDDSEHFRML